MGRIATFALLLTAVSVAFVGASLAGPPIAGDYTTLAGTVLPGRASESNPCDGCDGQIGNLIMGDSWNGAALGTQWKIQCPAISASPTLIFDGVVNGTGQRIYRTSYGGGTLWLTGAATWGGGDASYTSTLSSFTTIATVQIVNGSIVGVVSNINLTGNIDGYTNCLSMAISNAAMVGRTPGAAPGVWPAFQGPTNCAVTGTMGSWWTVNDVTLSLLGTCETPARTNTWGSLKTLYR